MSTLSSDQDSGMLGYRHAFHAGNHGDVLKHFVLYETLNHLNRKPKPWCYIDTHAGAGAYDLAAREAGKTGEHEAGIGRLLQATDLPEHLAAFVTHLTGLRAGLRGTGYPGSPLWAAGLARADDRLWCFERHPADCRALKELFRSDRRVRCDCEDGYAGLRALMPPPTRRGVVLMDPSYEMDIDYGAVRAALTDTIDRFATGTVLVWFPRLSRLVAQRLPERLCAAAGDRPWLQAMLDVREPPAGGLGLYGSGVFVLNPPWTLRDSLATVLPVLADLLAEPGYGRWRIDVGPETP